MTTDQQLQDGIAELKKAAAILVARGPAARAAVNGVFADLMREWQRRRAILVMRLQEERRRIESARGEKLKRAEDRYGVAAAALRAEDEIAAAIVDAMPAGKPL